MKVHVEIRIARLLLLLTCFAFFMPSARAEDGASKTVRVGYFENEVFQEGARPDTIKRGYAYEYYRKISEYTGWKYEYVYGSFVDVYDLFLEGKVDLIAGLAWKEERAGLMGYPELPMGKEDYILIKHESDLSITPVYATLNGKKIGVLNGAAMLAVINDFLSAHNISAQVLPFDSYEELSSGFDKQDFDILLAESDGTSERDYAEVLYSIGSADYYLCVSRTRPDLLEELNVAQSLLMADEPDYLHSLRMKYYSSSISSRSFSAAEKRWMRNHNEVLVGYLNNYIPYSGTDAAGNVTGLVKDIVPRLFAELGIGDMSVRFVGYDNYDDMVTHLGGRVVDAVFPVGGGLYYSEASGIHQSRPVLSSSSALVLNARDYDRGTDIYAVASSARFAINRNNKIQYYYARSSFPSAQFFFCDSIEECLDAVLDGSADCTTINGFRRTLLRSRRYHPLQEFYIAELDDQCFGVRIGDEGLLRLLNRGIGILGAEYFQDFAYHYEQQLYDYTIGDFLRDHMGLVISFIVLFSLFIIFFLGRYARHSRIASQAAENANQAKTMFLNNMSHEIRTPINAVLGMDEMILRESHEQSVLAYARNIRSSGNQLLAIINDILDFSKIESGKMEIINEDYDLRQTIRDVSSMCRERARSRGLDFIVQADEEMPFLLHGDELKLKQCLLNLLSNAIKYTPHGSVTTTFSFSRKDDTHVLLTATVADTGIGIREEDLPLLTRPFERIEVKRNRTIEGTGLGMSIVNGLLSQMGAELQIESVYGEGSSFSFTLEQEVRSWERIGVLEDSLADVDSAADGGYEEIFRAPSARVLVVDDTTMNLVVFCGLLKQTLVQIDTASGADEGLALARKKQYHIIFIDHFMPNKDGVEMLKALRADSLSLSRETPCIALTANAVNGAKSFYLSLGFQDYLSKPVSPKRLEKMVRDFLPAELLETSSRVAASGNSAAGGQQSGLGSDVSLLFTETFGLDIDAAFRNCGGKDLFRESLRYFYESIGEKADAIARYAEAADWKNFTIQVHALKSSARLIGATALSDYAKDLEEAGNRAQQDDGAAVQEIRERTPVLVSAYRGFEERLAPLCKKTADAAGDAEKKPLPPEVLKDALGALKELVSAFDYDSAGLVIAELDGYAMPENSKKAYAHIKKALENADAAALIKAIEECEQLQEGQGN